MLLLLLAIGYSSLNVSFPLWIWAIAIASTTIEAIKLYRLSLRR